MNKEHQYQISITWTGNRGTGTSRYQAYDRSHTIAGEGKAELLASADPAFRGDPTRYNPEELLLASLSSCHMLWYLHLCAVAGVVVVDYRDQATGVMYEEESGRGAFKEVTLHPVVTVLNASMIEVANDLHEKAHTMCFIANSVNFPVRHQPVCEVGGGAGTGSSV